MSGSRGLSSPVADVSVPVSNGVVHPFSSLHDVTSISVSESGVSWSSEAVSDSLNSSELITPEFSQVSDVPGVLVDVSEVSGLSSMVASS